MKLILTYCIRFIVTWDSLRFFYNPLRGLGLTAGVTGRQGMLTPPWHLISPDIFITQEIEM